ncbi:hypothetical protein CWE09_11345 [Aliidiomarina minuta]|uniref:Uncharacterized protein n=1 Tax=Aliidiomarina minuta TaxID=880057 RepID=A0A432W4N3_9GAMM|nr:hypothetical protein [Aliidiomarina minuta]RUO24448.1 hypothetical protein CWE09_11345 [Aliidiomarina minuta]
MDSWFVTNSVQKWLKAVVSIGNTLIEMSGTQADIHLSSTYEHFFVIAVGKSLEWGEELNGMDGQKYREFCHYRDRLPEARLVRNMREHDVAYLKGDGRRQSEFVKELDVNGGSMSASVDGTSTIVCDEGYLIGGRLNVKEAVRSASEALQKI